MQIRFLGNSKIIYANRMANLKSHLICCSGNLHLKNSVRQVIQLEQPYPRVFEKHAFRGPPKKLMSIVTVAD